jgi:ADP-ribose pyrophosphatase
MKVEDVDVEAKEVLYDGYFRIEGFRLRHRLHAGGWSRTLLRELFERGHAVAVLPYDPDRDEVILIEQFRIGAFAAGWNPWQIEVVAGIIEVGETPVDVARRECVEEIGVPVGELIKIIDYLPSPGGMSETMTLYCGRVDAAGAGGIHGIDGEDEDIRAFVLSADDALAALAAGSIENSAIIIALQWLAANRADLRRRWCGATGSG